MKLPVIETDDASSSGKNGHPLNKARDEAAHNNNFRNSAMTAKEHAKRHRKTTLSKNTVGIVA